MTTDSVAETASEDSRAAPALSPSASGDGARRFPSSLSSRTILLRLESQSRRLLILLLTLTGAALLARAVIAPAMAEHLTAGQATAGQIERALAWDPGNPYLHERLAWLELGAFPGDLDKARHHAQAALLRRPTHAGTWLQLAVLADREGQRAQAQEALDTALRLDQHNVTLRWEAALLLLRWGERARAVEHLRYVIAIDPAHRDAAFQLAGALLPPGVGTASLLPAAPEALTALLAGAVQRHDVGLAEASWEQRAALSPAVPDWLQRAYLQLVVSEGQGPAARRAWLAVPHPGSPHETDGNLIWNGGFEAERISGWGLDWQIRQTWGVEVALDRFQAARGRQSLRLAFNSYPTLDYAGVLQTVPVQAGGEYVLRALAKAVDFNTASGVKLQVTGRNDELLGETPAIRGTTTEWIPLEARVRVPADATLVQVRVRREKAPRPEGNLGGKVWLDEISLTPVRAIGQRSGG
jgi:tetratricopeptide (TPR) repeat protein